MLYNRITARFWQVPMWQRLVTNAVLWLLLISFLHYWLNMEKETRPVIQMGYMPVITNLAAPLLDYATQEKGPVRYSAIKFASFAEMAEALRNGQIQAAFIIAPLAIVLRQQGEDVRVVYIGNRHESTFVVRSDLDADKITDLEGKTVAVPMRYSGHNLGILKQLEEYHLTGRVNVVEMNPPDMAAALSAGSLDAYFVGEPFAAQTLKSGDAKLLFHVEDVWQGFICNLVIVKQSFIDQYPQRVQDLVQTAIRSGLWASKHKQQAARIASQYWNQPMELVSYALENPENRIIFNRYTPRLPELQEMADLMVHFGLLQTNEITGLIDDSFAEKADLNDVNAIGDIVK